MDSVHTAQGRERPTIHKASETAPTRAEQVGSLGLQSQTSCDLGDPRCRRGNGPGYGPGTTVTEEGMVTPGEEEGAKSKGPICSLRRDRARLCLQTPKGGPWMRALNARKAERQTRMLTYSSHLNHARMPKHLETEPGPCINQRSPERQNR